MCLGQHENIHTYIPPYFIVCGLWTWLLSFGNWYSHFRCKGKRIVESNNKYSNMSQALNWRVEPQCISLSPRQAHISNVTIPYQAISSWSFLGAAFIDHIRAGKPYVHQLKTHGNLFLCSQPPVLDTFLISIYEGLKEWLNHQFSCWSCTPSGWLIETSLAPLLQAPACWVNLHAIFNGMSLLWHGPRPCRYRTCPELYNRSESHSPVSWPGLKRV